MDREQFIQKIILRYAKSFDSAPEIQLWIDDYANSLHENINFDLLYDAMLKGYTSSTRPPMPAWLLEKWKEIRPRQSQQCEQLGEGTPPPPEFVDFIKKMRANKPKRNNASDDFTGIHGIMAG